MSGSLSISLGHYLIALRLPGASLFLEYGAGVWYSPADSDDGCLWPRQVGVHPAQQPHEPVEVPELNAADGPPFQNSAVEPPAGTRRPVELEHGFHLKTRLGHSLTQLLFRVPQKVP